MEARFSTFYTNRCDYQSHAVRRVELICYFVRFGLSIISVQLRLLFKYATSFFLFEFYC